MKTIRLKSILFSVLMLTGFAGSVVAQKDITSQYIVNATLSNGTTGWTVSNFNASQRGNNTVGYASEAYAGWGNLDVTSYSLTQNITLPKGSYRLVNYSFFRQGLRYNTNPSKSLAFLKAGTSQVAIKTLGSISGIPTNGDNGGYANSQADGANCFDSKMYRNVVEFDIDADNTSIEIGLVGTFDLKQSWVIAGMFELFDLNDVASVSSPTDVTYAITNPGFEYRNTSGWTTSGIVYQDNNWGNKAGVGFAEKWQWDAGLPNSSMTQELTGLANGLYELSVYAHNINQRNGDAAGKGMFLTANGAQTEIGAYGQYKVRATVTDGTLNIGILLNNCTGNWIAFDRFGLQFFGDPDAALWELLDGYISEAEGLQSSDDYLLLSTSQKAALQQAITNAKAATSSNLSDSVDALTLAIQTARQQIQLVKDNRSLMLAALERFENDYNLADGTDYRRRTMSAKAWTDLLDKVNAVSIALDDVSQAANYGTIKDELIAQMDATDASLRIFNGYKAMVAGTQTLGIAAGTTYAADGYMDSDETEHTAVAALNTAFSSYANAQDTDIDASVFLGDNLDFSAAQGAALNTENSNGIYSIADWEVVYADADTWAVLQNQHNEHAGQLYFRKNWGSAATRLTAAKHRMLPVGKYKLSFSWNSAMSNMTNLSYYRIGDAASVLIGKANNGDEVLEYEFEVKDEPQLFDLSFGFQKTGTDNSPAQIIVDNVDLTYIQSTLLLANSDVNDSKIEGRAGHICDVTLSGRTLYKDGNWNTLCLPFSTTKTGPLSDATVLEFDVDGEYGETGFDANDGTLYLYFKPATTIEANKPYLVKWESGADIVNPVFSKVTVAGGGASTVGTSHTSGLRNVEFIGVLSPVNIENGDKSRLYMGNGNTLYYPDTDNYTVKSCRAYFHVDLPQGSAGIRAMYLKFGDEATTGVNVIENGQFTMDNGQWVMGNWFDLNGRKVVSRDSSVSKLSKGIYINNGRKVVVK